MASPLRPRFLAAALILLVLIGGSLVLGDGVEAALHPDLHSRACALCVLALVLAGFLVLGSEILLQARSWPCALWKEALTRGLAPAILLRTRSPPRA